MRLPSRHALIVLAPLAFYTAGCAGPISISRSGHRPGPEQLQKRLLTMAQLYEGRGEYEAAHKLYCQVLQADPNHAVARQHATDLFLALRNEKPPVGEEPATAPAVEPSPLTPEPANKLARIRPRRPRLLTDAEVAARVPKPLKRDAELPFDHELAAEVALEDAEFETAPIAEAPAPVSEAVTAAAPASIKEFINEERLDVETLDFGESLPKVMAAGTRTVVIEKPFVIASNEAEPATGQWAPTSLSRMCSDASPEVIVVVGQLTSTDPDVRKSALEVLASMGDHGLSAAPAIRACLSDRDPCVQVYAAWALWQTACGDECIPTLQSLLTGLNDDAAALACYVLGEIGAPAEDVIESIARLQNHSSVGVRIHAAEAILKISDGDSGSVIVLANAIGAADVEERVLIADALGAAKGLDRAVAVETLITSLGDASPTVRAAAALALGGFGDKASKAMPALKRAALAADLETRAAAATALACITR